MEKRIKKQFWLSSEENDELKQKASLAGISESAVVRLLIRGYEPRGKTKYGFYFIYKSVG